MSKTVSLRDGILWGLAAVLLLAASSSLLQAQDYTPLEGLRVSEGGGVQYRAGFLSLSAGSGGCIELSNSSINGVVYTIHKSKWQRRAGSTWVDSPGTERDGLCGYSPTSPGEYRVVAEITIDGERGHYSSENTLTVEGEEIPELEPVTTLYFPDYVDGGGWSVQLAVSNIDTTAAAAVVVTAYDQEGQPIPEFFDSEGTFEIPALGSRVLRSTGMGEIRRGWIEVGTDTASVSGLLTYRNTGTGLEVSVEPVELGNHFALFVEESSGIGTGLAIFKPDPASTIEFRIRDEDGINPLGEGFVTHPVTGERPFNSAWVPSRNGLMWMGSIRSSSTTSGVSCSYGPRTVLRSPRSGYDLGDKENRSHRFLWSRSQGFWSPRRSSLRRTKRRSTSSSLVSACCRPTRRTIRISSVPAVSGKPKARISGRETIPIGTRVQIRER